MDSLIFLAKSPQAGNNLVASRQAGTHLPPGEGSNTPQAGNNLVASRQAGAHLPSGEAAIPLWPGLSFPLGKEMVQGPPSQV